jgi:RNA polymerase sigma-70 factor (ECF subfamily)
MPLPDSQPSAGRSGDGRFDVTRWSIVLAARGDEPAAREAMEYLCANYWYPLYAFVRRQRHDPHDAHDLTQAFFARLLEKGWLDRVAREKGKFRSFLLAAMKHFLANERDRDRALKRGGGRALISLDAQTAESRYAVETVDGLTPEKIFERRWALQLLEQVLNRLRAEFVAGGKTDLFDQLKSTLSGQEATWGEIANRLAMTEGAVKVAAHRLRRRYRELIREEIAQTVGNERDVDEELRDLMAAVSG